MEHLQLSGNGSHAYELEGTQGLNPQGGNATGLPPKGVLLG